MSGIFKKEDIKAGYLLVVKETLTGEVFNMTVVPGLTYGVEKMGAVCPGKHWWALGQFNDELIYPIGRKKFEIQAVYGYAYNKSLLDNSTELRDKLWERETKPEPKKMTVAEIAETLGYPVEIVEG